MPIFFTMNKSPKQWHIEISFSNKPEKKADKYVSVLDKSYETADENYRKHNIHGDHQYLIPVNTEFTNNMMTPDNQPTTFKQIGTDPTIPFINQKLQLLPCSESNLGLFQKKLQSEPFYIKVEKRSFSLYVWHLGMYWKIPSHRYTPIDWTGHTHPVVTLDTANGPIQFSSAFDIPWSDIAHQLGVKEVPVNEPAPFNVTQPFGMNQVQNWAAQSAFVHWQRNDLANNWRPYQAQNQYQRSII